jgi:hypothetical protein
MDLDELAANRRRHIEAQEYPVKIHGVELPDAETYAQFLKVQDELARHNGRDASGKKKTWHYALKLAVAKIKEREKVDQELENLVDL